MKLHSIATAVVMMSSCVAGFAANSINCRVNADTGAVEATSPWRNSLGVERADSICKASNVPATPLRAAASTLPMASVPVAQPVQMLATEQIIAAQPAQAVVASRIAVAHAQTPSVITRATPAPVSPDSQIAIAGPVVANAALPAAVTASAGPFVVTASDRTIREVLQRWARASGWQHEPVHWTFQRDFPIQGTASAEYFSGDFKEATRKLLASTETTDLPAQPCFYSNFIVRVVPQAEQCDRTATIAQ